MNPDDRHGAQPAAASRYPASRARHAAWGIIRAGQRARGNFKLGCDVSGTDYAAIARGFGCRGETVRDAAEVGPAIARALASGLPAVIDAHCRFEPHPCMLAFGRMNRFAFAAPAPS